MFLSCQISLTHTYTKQPFFLDDFICYFVRPLPSFSSPNHPHLNFWYRQQVIGWQWWHLLSCYSIFLFFLFFSLPLHHLDLTCSTSSLTCAIFSSSTLERMSVWMLPIFCQMYDCLIRLCTVSTTHPPIPSIFCITCNPPNPPKNTTIVVNTFFLRTQNASIKSHLDQRFPDYIRRMAIRAWRLVHRWALLWSSTPSSTTPEWADHF